MEGVIAPTVLSGNCVCTSLSNCDFVQGAVQGGVACACTSHKDRNKTRTMQSKSLMGCASSAATAARPRSPYSAIPAAQCRRSPAVRTLQCRNSQCRSRTSRYAIAHDHIRSQERKHVHRVGCVVHHDDIERTIKVGRWPDRRDRWQSHPVPDRRNRRHERYTRTQLIGCCLRAGCRCRNALLRRYSRNANLEDLPVVLADTTTDDQSRRRRGQGRKCKDRSRRSRIEKALHHLTLAKRGWAGSAARPKAGSLGRPSAFELDDENGLSCSGRASRIPYRIWQHIGCRSKGSAECSALCDGGNNSARPRRVARRHDIVVGRRVGANRHRRRRAIEGDRHLDPDTEDEGTLRQIIRKRDRYTRSCIGNRIDRLLHRVRDLPRVLPGSRTKYTSRHVRSSSSRRLRVSRHDDRAIVDVIVTRLLQPVDRQCRDLKTPLVIKQFLVPGDLLRPIVPAKPQHRRLTTQEYSPTHGRHVSPCSRYTVRDVERRPQNGRVVHPDRTGKDPVSRILPPHRRCFLDINKLPRLVLRRIAVT